MNEHFSNLPIEKQQRIINAALKVFSRNEYKKAPMSQIAEEGNISKGLLFHYFKNKKELYLYLWQFSINLVFETLNTFNTVKTQDFFEMLKRSLFAKCSVMRKYPYIFSFLLKAYYEHEPELQQSIHNHYANASKKCEDKVLELIDKKLFRNDIDLKMMYKEIIMATDGYMYQKYHTDIIDPDDIEKDFTILIEHWRTIYYTEEAIDLLYEEKKYD